MVMLSALLLLATAASAAAGSTTTPGGNDAATTTSTSPSAMAAAGRHRRAPPGAVVAERHRRDLRAEDVVALQGVAPRGGESPCPWDLVRYIDVLGDGGGDDGGGGVGGSVVMNYALVPSSSPGSNDGVLCVRLEVSIDDDDGDVGWIGLAISPDGRMGGSRAVIGILPSLGGGGGGGAAVGAAVGGGDGSVRMYDLSRSVWQGYAEPTEDGRQTLMDASVRIEYYNDDEDDDAMIPRTRAVLTFAKYLVEDYDFASLGDGHDGDLPIYEGGTTNNFLYAKGGIVLPGEGGGGEVGELGYHSEYAVFRKDFADDITDVSIYHTHAYVYPLSCFFLPIIQNAAAHVVVVVVVVVV